MFNTVHDCRELSSNLYYCGRAPEASTHERVLLYGTSADQTIIDQGVHMYLSLKEMFALVSQIKVSLRELFSLAIPKVNVMPSMLSWLIKRFHAI